MKPACEVVRLFAATESGQVAARFRRAGYAPDGTKRGATAEEYGAARWADACGFSDLAERKVFIAAFLEEIGKQDARLY